jgi:hypothetical protein
MGTHCAGPGAGDKGCQTLHQLLWAALWFFCLSQSILGHGMHTRPLPPPSEPQYHPSLTRVCRVGGWPRGEGFAGPPTSERFPAIWVRPPACSLLSAACCGAVLAAGGISRLQLLPLSHNLFPRSVQCTADFICRLRAEGRASEWPAQHRRERIAWLPGKPGYPGTAPTNLVRSTWTVKNGLAFKFRHHACCGCLVARRPHPDRPNSSHSAGCINYQSLWV